MSKSQTTEAGTKARRAAEAARRADELAEQARLAAEEAAQAKEALEAEAADEDAEDDHEVEVEDEVEGAVADTPEDEAPEDQAPDVSDEPESESDTAGDDAPGDDAPDDDAPDDSEADDSEAGDGAAGDVIGGGRRRVLPRRVRPAAGDGGDGGDRDGAGSGARLAVAVLGVVTVLLAGLIAYLVQEKRDLAAMDKARDQALHAATLAAQDISSYDYRTMDSDLRRALAHTTGKFRTDFEREIPRVKSAAQSSKTIVEGTAIKTGIEDAGAKRVVALVYLNQQTVKESSTQQLPTQYRIRLTMVKIDGRWLVERLDMV